MDFLSLVFLHFCEMTLLLLRELPFLFPLFLPNSHFHHTVAKRQMIKSPTHSSFSTQSQDLVDLTAMAPREQKEEEQAAGFCCGTVRFVSSGLASFFPEHSYLVILSR